MDIQIVEKENVKIANVIGELTIHSEKIFKEEVYPLFKSDQKSIAINMSEIDYIDSTGIGTLVNAMNVARSHKKDLILYDFNPKIERMFDNVGLKNFFKIMNKQDFERTYF